MIILKTTYLSCIWAISLKAIRTFERVEYVNIPALRLLFL
jgi:hypothetical protein